MSVRKAIVYCLLIAAFTPSAWSDEKLALTADGENYVITADGKPFASVVADSFGTPIVFPVVTAGGVEVTRDYPMRDKSQQSAADPSRDHPHHRSLWLTHGNVNGVDFWAIDPFNTEPANRKRGTIRAKLDTPSQQENAVVVSMNNEWVTPKNETICTEKRTLRFASQDVAGQVVRIIDVDSVITAVQDKVVFGDTKEGTFGVRVHDAMRVKNGGKKYSGAITNAERLTDDAAWGKRSAWCDYRGMVGEQRVGVTILNHPTSLRFPTYWHVRDYGLFAANPFGVNDFDKSGDGAFTLARGESFTLRYRILITDGELSPETIDTLFKVYENTR
ncbi:MAG: PmoA family protein [Thermoguttaceae bacterium]